MSKKLAGRRVMEFRDLTHSEILRIFNYSGTLFFFFSNVKIR